MQHLIKTASSTSNLKSLASLFFAHNSDLATSPRAGRVHGPQQAPQERFLRRSFHREKQAGGWSQVGLLDPTEHTRKVGQRPKRNVILGDPKVMTVKDGGNRSLLPAPPFLTPDRQNSPLFHVHIPGTALVFVQDCGMRAWSISQECFLSPP